MLSGFLRLYRRACRTISYRLANRIFATMLLVSVFPLTLLTVYTNMQVSQINRKASGASQEILARNVTGMQMESLSNHAMLIEKELRHIESQVEGIRRYAEEMFRQPAGFGNIPGDGGLVYDEAMSYYYTPYHEDLVHDRSTLFITSRVKVTPGLLDEIKRTKHLEVLFRSALRRNRNLVAAYFIFRDGVTRIYPALDFPDLIARGKLFADMDFNRYVFYAMATPPYNPEGEVKWTPPYFDVTDRGWMVTANAPVYAPEGELIGVIGLDVTIDNIVTNILETRFEQPGGYAFLMRETGQLIAFPEKGLGDIGLAGKGSPDVNEVNLREILIPGVAELAGQMSQGGRGFVKLGLGGEQKYVLYTPIRIGWVLAYVIPEREMVAPVLSAAGQISSEIRQLNAKVSLGILWSFLAVVVASVFLSQRVTLSINKLIKGAEAIGRGGLAPRVVVEGNDEIASLANSFNQMSEKLRESMMALNRKAQEQEELNLKLQELNATLEAKVRARTLELEQTNARLQDAYQRLREMEKSRRALVANISHDLRTPLSSIIGCAEAVRDQVVATPETIRKYLDIVVRKAHYLNRLIQDLFQLSQLEAGQLQMNFVPYHSRALLEYYLDKIQPEIERRGIRFEFEADGHLPWVQVDIDRLEQVLENLVANAVRHTPAGGAITVRASGRDALTVCVQDTGEGIQEEDLPRVFERFYRGSSGVGAKGSGLGLAIAREIVEAHNGRIWVESTVGKGSCFYFSIPGINEPVHLPAPHTVAEGGKGDAQPENTYRR